MSLMIKVRGGDLYVDADAIKVVERSGSSVYIDLFGDNEAVGDPHVIDFSSDEEAAGETDRIAVDINDARIGWLPNGCLGDDANDEDEEEAQ